MAGRSFLSEEEKARINQVIRDVEAETAGELVTVIAQTSDDYLYIPLLWASVIALLLPGAAYLLASSGNSLDLLPHWGWGALTDYAELYILQILVFCFCAVLFRHPKVKMYLIPARIKHRRAHRHAHYCFLEHGLHKTQARNGIMIFVSVAEHHVEILADQGIHQHLSNDVWQALVDALITAIRAGQVAEGFVQTVDACGALLKKHFPDQRNNRNELPDHLIEID